jgi:hypothetical protein
MYYLRSPPAPGPVSLPPKTKAAKKLENYLKIAYSSY